MGSSPDLRKMKRAPWPASSSHLFPKKRGSFRSLFQDIQSLFSTEAPLIEKHQPSFFIGDHASNHRHHRRPRTPVLDDPEEFPIGPHGMKGGIGEVPRRRIESRRR